MKDKIIESSRIEFSNKGYNDASINEICKRGKFSKGIVYHYFENKEKLYLVCMDEVYNNLLKYLKEFEDTLQKPMDNIINYFILRNNYFNGHPIDKKLFINSVFNPPQELMKDLLEVKTSFNTYNKALFRKIVGNLDLKEGFEIDTLLVYLETISNVINSDTQLNYQENDYDYIEYQEKKMVEAINILFYGIVEKGDCK